MASSESVVSGTAEHYGTVEVAINSVATMNKSGAVSCVTILSTPRCILRSDDIGNDFMICSSCSPSPPREEKGLGDEEVRVWRWIGKTLKILRSTSKGLQPQQDT